MKPTHAHHTATQSAAKTRNPWTVSCVASPFESSGDGHDEDEVDEELEPGRAALAVVVLERPEARRHRELAHAAHQRPLKSGGRFSTNAFRPSVASSDARAR